MICAPCFAAIGAMRRELGSWRKTGFAVLYQTGLAYMVATIFYQFYSVLSGRGVSWMIVFAIVFLLFIAHMMFSRNPMLIFRPFLRLSGKRRGGSA